MSGQRRLAWAVLMQAIQDCCIRRSVIGRNGRVRTVYVDEGTTPSGSNPKDAADARMFLSTRSDIHDFWCIQAGLDPDAVIQKYYSKLLRHVA